jgi:hypothetical protein
MGTVDRGVSLFAGAVALGGSEGCEGVLGGWRARCGMCRYFLSNPQFSAALTLVVRQPFKLVESINQTAEGESLIPGLCAFLLGVCYEFNREPGEITRFVFFSLLSAFPSR